MARQIATILSLRDKISSPLVKVSKNVKNVSRDMKKAQNQVRRWGRESVKAVDKVVKGTLKATTVMAGATTALATKVGFSEAMDMEGYRSQLETATKDTVKAGKAMVRAVKFANATPFETGQVVEATAMMETYHLSSKRWLTDIADMAGSTNKSIMQATEAMADAAVGEFERLKEFGIRKDDIMLESAKRFGEGVVFDAKGHMLDQEKMMDVLQSIMQDKFKGGAEKLAGTARGLWSTITGVTKSSLAKIVGMQEDGTVRQGSLYAKLKEKMKEAADTLQQWQKDGTIEKIGTQVTETVTKAISGIRKVSGFIKKHEKLITTILVAIGGFYTAIKIISGIKMALMALNTIWLLFNGTLALTPLGWIVLGITAVITAAYALYRNWDTVVNFFSETVAAIGDWFSSMWDGAKAAFKAFLNFFISGINSVIKGLNSIKVDIPEWVPKFGGKKFGIDIEEFDTFAKGGIATKPSIFGETGRPEMAIPLEKGNPRSKMLLRQAQEIIGVSNEGVTINNISNQTTNHVENRTKQEYSGMFGAKVAFKKVLSLFINGTKSLLDNLSSIKIDMPELIPKAGVSIKFPTFAKGGIATKPSIFGETGRPEMAIPLEKNNPRSKTLIKQAQEIIGGADESVTINNISNQTTTNVDGTTKQESKQDITIIFNREVYGGKGFIEEFKEAMTDAVMSIVVKQKALAKANMAQGG